jgi:APA family basic amino acid/polyamine antiporter
MEREDASTYISKDSEMPRVLHTKDFLALGVGTIVSTAIFTLPGVVAAKYAGPGVVFSFLLAAVVAGFVALAYAEMASTLPVAGSAYSFILLPLSPLVWSLCYFHVACMKHHVLKLF